MPWGYNGTERYSTVREDCSWICERVARVPEGDANMAADGGDIGGGLDIQLPFTISTSARAADRPRVRIDAKAPADDTASHVKQGAVSATARM